MRQRKQRRPLFTLISIITLGLIGGLIGGLYFFVFGGRGSDEDVPLLPPAFNTPGAEAVLSGTATLPASAFPEIIIPAADVDVKIVTSYLRPEGWQISHLGDQVGHLEGTAWLDNPIGNIVLAGHVELSDGRRGAFASIGGMVEGDLVTLRENNVSHEYRVIEIKEVPADDLSVVQPTGSPIVTLITCSDYNFLNDTYESRIVVIAEKVS